MVRVTYGVANRVIAGFVCVLAAALAFAQEPPSERTAEEVKPAPTQWPGVAPGMLQAGVAPDRSKADRNDWPQSPQGQAFEQMVAQAPAPQWVREGVRISYQVEPANDAGGPGSGVMSVDIVSVARGEVAMEVRQYASSGEGLVLTTVTGVTGAVGRGSDYWMSPQLLAQLEQQPLQGMQVRKAQLTLNNKQIPVYAVITQSGTASYAQEMGVLLYHTNGQVNTKFLDLRQRQLPWLKGRPPAWLGKTKRLTYTGAVTLTQQGNQQLPVTSTMDVIGVGPNVIACKRSLVVRNPQAGGGEMPQESVVVSGPSQTSGLWLPPLGIRELKQGQVVDEDKVVGSKVSVGFIGRSPYGRNVVTLLEEGQGYTVAGDFEIETGILLTATQVVKAQGLQITIQLTGLQ